MEISYVLAAVLSAKLVDGKSSVFILVCLGRLEVFSMRRRNDDEGDIAKEVDWVVGSCKPPYLVKGLVEEELVEEFVEEIVEEIIEELVEELVEETVEELTIKTNSQSDSS